MTQEREKENRERIRKFVEERKSRTREQRIEHLLNRDGYVIMLRTSMNMMLVSESGSKR